MNSTEDLQKRKPKRKISVKELTDHDKKLYETQFEELGRLQSIRFSPICSKENKWYFEKFNWRKRLAKDVTKELKNHRVIAAILDGKIIGFSTFRVQNADKRGEQRAYIGATYVHPNFTKQGLATLLVHNVKKRIPAVIPLYSRGIHTHDGIKLLQSINANPIDFHELYQIENIKKPLIKSIKLVKMKKQRVIKRGRGL